MFLELVNMEFVSSCKQLLCVAGRSLSCSTTSLQLFKFSVVPKSLQSSTLVYNLYFNVGMSYF